MRALAILLFSSRAIVWASADTALPDLKSALASNDTAEVRSAEERLLSGNNGVETLLAAGGLLAAHDMLAHAALLFEKCAERFPGSFEAKYNLALARIGLNDFAAAEKTLNGISPQSPQETAAVDYLTGKIYAGEGRPHEAQQRFEKAYRTNPAVENYALDLALLLIRSAAYVPAIQILQQARARHPESPELGLELALAEALSGQVAAAASISAELTRQDPQWPTPRLIAAFSQCQAANYQACALESSAGLALPHPDPYLYYLHAQALWNSAPNRPEQVLTELGAAIDKMPGCSVCFLLRSKVLEAAHQDQAAITDLKAVLAHDSQQAQAWYLLSLLYRKAGQSAEASAALNRYRALHETKANGEIESFRKQLLSGLGDRSK
jgi:predicted Zn-dependent protease